MKNPKKVNHNDLTILKHAKIYQYYQQLCAEHRQRYPEISEFIARSYYYAAISKKFNLTPNYICSIICRIMSDEQGFKRDLIRAGLNQEEEQEAKW